MFNHNLWRINKPQLPVREVFMEVVSPTLVEQFKLFMCNLNKIIAMYEAFAIETGFIVSIGAYSPNETRVNCFYQDKSKECFPKAIFKFVYTHTYDIRQSVPRGVYKKDFIKYKEDWEALCQKHFGLDYLPFKMQIEGLPAQFEFPWNSKIFFHNNKVVIYAKQESIQEWCNTHGFAVKPHEPVWSNV